MNPRLIEAFHFFRDFLSLFFPKRRTSLQYSGTTFSFSSANPVYLRYSRGVDSMGWLDYHLHLFCIRRKHAHSITLIGIPDEYRFEDDPEITAGWEVSISEFFYDVRTTFDYEYDFGDSWKHEAIHEGILLREKEVKYPVCVGGARACPPEDCGGVPGYYRMLDIISNSNHEEYEEMITWLGKKYDPEQFVSNEVKFDNPKKRWRQRRDRAISWTHNRRAVGSGSRVFR